MRETAVLEKISFFYTFVGNTVTIQGKILRDFYEKLKMQFLVLQWTHFLQIWRSVPPTQNIDHSWPIELQTFNFYHTLAAVFAGFAPKQDSVRYFERDYQYQLLMLEIYYQSMKENVECFQVFFKY